MKRKYWIAAKAEYQDADQNCGTCLHGIRNQKEYQLVKKVNTEVYIPKTPKGCKYQVREIEEGENIRLIFTCSGKEVLVNKKDFEKLYMRNR